MMQVTLYSKRECPLCDEARRQLKELQSQFSHELYEIDIATDEALLNKYSEKVPVVKVGAYTLQAPFEAVDLQVALAAAKDSPSAERPPLDEGSRNWGMRLNRGMLFFTKHWLGVFSAVIFVYSSLPFVAPMLMKAGISGPARAIYTVYSPLCHQLAFRSWFLFGEQAAYPRELAGTGLLTLEEVTGIPDDDFWEARSFVGNETIGYKVALCERDVAIYWGIFIAGIVFAFVRKRLKPLPVPVWIVLGILPIALDGGSQLLAFLPVIPFPARESTPFLRTFTGALFGIMNVWLAYPHVQETMAETRQIVATKLAIASQRTSTNDSS
jgi:uncharacterized membrane protein/glutaredoxin